MRPTPGGDPRRRDRRLLLAGCSSGNIGESWQCPLAEGGACDSVAAADPAVPDRQAGKMTVLGEPLWRVRPAAPETGTLPCATACDGGFDPIAWLARLFEADPGPVAGASDEAEAPPPTPDPGPIPAGPDIAEDDAGGDGLRDEELRTDEVVARIWIAPFVDADGVYREASYIRVVLEPAGWRLP